MLKNILNEIKTNKAISFVIIMAVVVFVFYVSNFHSGLSEDNGKWGAFGDYIGGILNPIIAGVALYLIAKTYDLQKIELEKTRDLLKLSTDAQEKQIKLAALTALLNSNLTRINILESEKISLLQRNLTEPTTPLDTSEIVFLKEFAPSFRFKAIKNEIEKIKDDNIDLENKIKYFLLNTPNF